MQISQQLVSFYTPFFQSQEVARQFIEKVYSGGEIAQQAFNSIHRLVSLADDLEQIRPGESIIKLFFLVVCIEAIQNIAKPDHQDSNVQLVIEFFQDYSSPGNKALLEKGFQRSPRDQDRRGVQITVDTVGRILCELRNDFVHEGVHTGFHLAPNEDSKVENSLIVKEDQDSKREERTYLVSLTYEQLRQVVVESALAFLRELLPNK